MIFYHSCRGFNTHKPLRGCLKRFLARQNMLTQAKTFTSESPGFMWCLRHNRKHHHMKEERCSRTLYNLVHDQGQGHFIGLHQEAPAIVTTHAAPIDGLNPSATALQPGRERPIQYAVRGKADPNDLIQTCLLYTSRAAKAASPPSAGSTCI